MNKYHLKTKSYFLKTKSYFLKTKSYFNNFTKNNPLGSIIGIIIIFSSISIYFIIPTYYNYENYDNEIQKKILKDFKLNLKNIKGIRYSILPAPHFKIEECDIYFSESPEEKLANVKNLKINVFSKNLHIKEKIELKNIILNKIDFDLQFADLKNFYNHLQYSISKPIYIKNSNLFFRDKKKEIISISKIQKIDYFIDFQNKDKNLNILGNLFGSNFTFVWEKNFSNSKFSKSNLKFKNPNFNINNNFNKSNNGFIEARTELIFLENNLDLNYKFNKEKIEFIESKNIIRNNKTSKLIGSVSLNPFFLDLKLFLSNIAIETALNNILLNLYRSNQVVNFNFNGDLKIYLDQVNNRLFENFILNFRFHEEKISLNESSLDLKKIGKINFYNLSFYERDQKLFAKSKIKFDVIDQEMFYRKFQVSKKNRIDLNKINFEAEYNVDDKIYYLSNINFNENSEKEITFYEVNNIQQLNYIVSKEFKKISSD